MPEPALDVEGDLMWELLVASVVVRRPSTQARSSPRACGGVRKGKRSNRATLGGLATRARGRIARVWRCLKALYGGDAWKGSGGHKTASNPARPSTKRGPIGRRQRWSVWLTATRPEPEADAPSPATTFSRGGERGGDLGVRTR